MSGLIPSNWFLTFLARPCCFRALRNKKYRKFRCFLWFSALFTIFLASSTSVSTWSRWKPKNSSSLAYPGNFDTLFNPVALSIADWNTVKPVNSKLFEKQQKVYYCQEFTIEKVIYVINWLKSSQKKFTIDLLFTIDQFTIARFECTWVMLNLYLAKILS